MGMSENLQLRYREKVEGLMRDPDLRHKMTRNELLTVVQLLVATALHLGEEASRACRAADAAATSADGRSRDASLLLRSQGGGSEP